MDRDALYTHAVSLHEEGKKEEALQAYQDFFLVSPLEPEPLRHYAILLGEMHRYEEALDAINFCIALEPNSGNSYVCQNAILGQLGRIQDAGRAAKKALYFSPSCPAAHWNYSLWLLQQGRLKEGWEHYRWGVVNGQRALRTLQPEWTGIYNVGDTLLIWSEQGFGDTIQFSRLVRLVKNRYPGLRIIFEVQEMLVSLMLKIEGADEVIAQTKDKSIPSEVKHHIALISLPRLLGIDKVSDIPSDCDYIPVEQELVRQAQEFHKDKGTDSKFKVGIAWQGRKAHANDVNRSAKVEDFICLTKSEDSVIFSLQKDFLPPAGSGIISVAESFSSWAVTAAFVKTLDLVISVDTAIAHLAGALGVPTFIMLPFSSEWRWLLEREDSPWYPSARLFKQSKRGDWGSVMEKIVNELQSSSRADSKSVLSSSCQASTGTDPQSRTSGLSRNRMLARVHERSYSSGT